MSILFSKIPSAAAAPAHPAICRQRVGQACALFLSAAIGLPLAQAQAQAQEETDKTLKEVVISASRAEQRRLDAPGAIHSAQVDSFRSASP